MWNDETMSVVEQCIRVITFIEQHGGYRRYKGSSQFVVKKC